MPEDFTVEDDHLPFVEAGVPSIDIIDLDYPQWHTAQDDLDHVSARSLQIVGDVVLDALPQIEKLLLRSSNSATPNHQLPTTKDFGRWALEVGSWKLELPRVRGPSRPDPFLINGRARHARHKRRDDGAEQSP